MQRRDVRAWTWRARALQGPADGELNSEVSRLREGSALICFLFPSSNLHTVQVLCQRNITAFAMDLVPRITRAQSMDALSSMSTIAGYRGALMAAGILKSTGAHAWDRGAGSAG